MSNPSRHTGAGYTALRDLRRALLRASLVSGSLAVLVLMAFGHGGERSPRTADAQIDLDEIMTGSIASNDRYVLSRSVLQPAGSGPCLYYPDGSRQGRC